MTEKAPDIAGTITGWRAFTLQGGVLHALNGPERGTWGAGENWASCWARKIEMLRKLGYAHEEDEPVPAIGCGCGFWAYAFFEDLDRQMTDGLWPSLVPGRVELWGRVVEHERGWRAARARITGIGQCKDQEALCADYKCEALDLKWRTKPRTAASSHTYQQAMYAAVNPKSAIEQLLKLQEARRQIMAFRPANRIHQNESKPLNKAGYGERPQGSET